MLSLSQTQKRQLPLFYASKLLVDLVQREENAVLLCCKR